MRALLLSLMPWILAALCYCAEGREGLAAAAFMWLLASPMMILIAAVIFDHDPR